MKKLFRQPDEYNNVALSARIGGMIKKERLTVEYTSDF